MSSPTKDPSMPASPQLGSQVKNLLSGVSDHGTQHLTEVETDLVQTAVLLGEAIEKLGASFLAIHAAVTAQQEIVELLLAGKADAPEVAQRIKAVHGEIGAHVNAAVTGLQFQDLTNQLIERTVKRVAGLRQFLGALGTSGAVVMPESDNEQLTALLEGVNHTLVSQSQELDGFLRKAVHQENLGCGDIELF